MTKHSELAEEIVRALFIESLDGAFFDWQCSIVDQKLSGGRKAIRPLIHAIADQELISPFDPRASKAINFYESLKVE